MPQIQSVHSVFSELPVSSIGKRITWGAVIVLIPDCGVPQARATAVLFKIAPRRFVTGPKEKRNVGSNDTV